MHWPPQILLDDPREMIARSYQALEKITSGNFIALNGPFGTKLKKGCTKIGMAKENE